MTVLLAKSAHKERSLSLKDHLRETDEAACAVFDPKKRQVRQFLRFFKLTPADYKDFRLHLRLSALAHDIGKANADFQAALTSTGFLKQEYRHEHLSALFLCEPSIWKWMSSGGVDMDVVTAAVLSHHMKAGTNRSEKHGVLAITAEKSVRLHFDDPQIATALGWIQDVAKLPPAPTSFPADHYAHAGWADAMHALFDHADEFQKERSIDSRRWRLSLAVKAGLVVSDSVASGLWRTEKGIQTWLDGTLHSVDLTSDLVHEEVLKHRIAAIGERWNGYHQFQENAGSVGRRGLLLAGCGTGKTLAAWRWVQARVAEERVGRAIFLYPTRDTATEGFKDYLLDSPDAVLVHSTSDFEMIGIRSNLNKEDGKSDEHKENKKEKDERMFALGHWNKRYFSATVDQFLSFVENNYGGVCLLPVLADSALILDEVHSYDNKMWDSLVTFLKWFDVPVLCMTASLPPERKQQLEQLGLSIYPKPEDRSAMKDLEEQECAPRYKLTRLDMDQNPIDVAVKAYKEGKKVLWVHNTVASCQRAALDLREALNVGTEVVQCYHSRFIVRDRNRIRNKTVGMFKPSHKGATIAVTTQVCEMSLDLDADVLITEEAPVPSLVQRFGRCHRHLRPNHLGLLYTYSTGSTLPYETAELVQGATFISFLLKKKDAVISQRDLSSYLEQMENNEMPPTGDSSFITGGYYATGKPFREFDGGVPAVLSRDLDAMDELCKHKDPRKEEFMITVPESSAEPHEHEHIPKYIQVAPVSQYSLWLGFVKLNDTTIIADAAPFFCRE